MDTRKSGHKEICMSVRRTLVLCMAVAFVTMLGTWKVATAAGSDAHTYIESKALTDRFGKPGPLASSDQYTVTANRRTANGKPEIHEKETDIFYIVDGSATLVIGGTAIEAKQTRPFQMLGTSIEGGQSYEVKEGDFFVIPAGTPHWYKQVNGSVNYLTIKSIKP